MTNKQKIFFLLFWDSDVEESKMHDYGTPRFRLNN